MVNPFGLPEVTTPIFSKQIWTNGVAVFEWSDGSATQFYMSQSEALDLLKRIQASGGAKPAEFG